MDFLLVLSGGIVQLSYIGYLIFCLKIDLRNTYLLRKNPINNNDQQHKNLAHSSVQQKIPSDTSCGKTETLYCSNDLCRMLFFVENWRT